MLAGVVLLVATLGVSALCCVQLLDGWRQVTVEERARRSQIVFRGLAVAEGGPVDSRFWIMDVYKGAETLASMLGLDPGAGGFYNLRDRRVNVTGFSGKTQCTTPVTSQNYYIVFSELRGGQLVAKYDDLFGAVTEWTPENEERVWVGVGWEVWSIWSPCSVSCGDGVQERRRLCNNPPCHGYNKERRRCNMFSCQGAVSPLDLEDRRFFHQSHAKWERVPGRNSAWRLRPNSYIWVPSTELFPPPGHFPKEFSLLVTLRLPSQIHSQGTIFSLRSRRQQDAYLSLELGAAGSVKLVHAGPNGTQTVDVAAPMGDGEWHQLALGLHGDSSVKSYLDCAWVSTDILKRNSLDTPEDADIVIGYLFLGDLEQLVIVPTPAAVSQQCSGTRIPMVDPTLLLVAGNHTSQRRRSKGRKGVDYKHLADVAGKQATLSSSQGLDPDTQRDERKIQTHSEQNEDLFEGSGSEVNDLDNTQYEVEWSEWSECSASCGQGTQSRYSRCVDDGSRLELCMEAGEEKTESRACGKGACRTHKKQIYKTVASNNTVMNVSEGRNTQQGVSKLCECQHGGVCRSKRRSCHCTQGYWGRRCEHATCPGGCLHGGHCSEPGRCICTPEYSGDHCQTAVCEPPCRHGGQCVRPHTCHCPRGTSGDFCQNFSCRAPCVNGGTCVGPDQCECPRNATGPTCATPVCDPPCENGASCAAGNTCHCEEGTSGTRCEKRKCEYQPHQEPYTRGFRRLVSRRFQTKCDPWGWKTCVHTQPEYRTVYKTFYRTVYKCTNTPAVTTQPGH